jgi:lipoprotein-anchoring transpeptidase ErfK/SrfK
VPTGEPHGPYGVYALGLSGFSDVITDWIGGGRLAIHGTDDPADRGHDVSHGCVRVYNPQMRSLTDVPLGTPVWIHP